MNLSRGDVGLARFPHAAGGRGKKRPVVVVQGDDYNRKLRHVIVAEVTTKGALNNKVPKMILTRNGIIGDHCGYAGRTSN